MYYSTQQDLEIYTAAFPTSKTRASQRIIEEKYTLLHNKQQLCPSGPCLHPSRNLSCCLVQDFARLDDLTFLVFPATSAPAVACRLSNILFNVQNVQDGAAGAKSKTALVMI